MTSTREYYSPDGRRTVTVENWSHADTVCLVAARWEFERPSLRQHLGTLFIDYCPEAQAIVRECIANRCPAGVLADWIEEHPDCWRCPGVERDAAVECIARILRESTYSTP